MDTARRFAVVGPGRLGRAMAAALGGRGWIEHGTYGRHDRPSGLADEVDVVLLTVPDDAIQAAAAAIAPGRGAVVHTSGATDLSALAPHERVGSIHPLVSIPDPATGASRLTSGIVFAVAGDPVTTEIAEVLGGRPIRVPDERRALYHATAAVAANHLVVLCAQVERLAAQAGVPVEAYWALMTTTLANVGRNGALPSLTGPASRGDHATIRAHLDALPSGERPLYRALADEAARLAAARPSADTTTSP